MIDWEPKLTVYGIETPINLYPAINVSKLQQYLPFTVLKRCFFVCIEVIRNNNTLQQHLPFTVCAEGCEIAEEQSDDEVRTSQVPERSEGKTKVIKQQSLPFTVLKLNSSHDKIPPCGSCNSTYRLRY